jgi:23S rRNA pseudouridine1911/1915/1917 synthase
MSHEKATFNVSADEAGLRVDRIVVDRLHDLSRSAVRRLIDEGHVTVNAAPIKAGRSLREGDEVSVSVPPLKPATPEPQDIPLDVVYEDSDLIVVNKPAGLVVHPAPGHPDGTLVNALLHHCQDLSGIGGVRRPGIVHRIDRDTTGLLAVAKNDMAHLALKEQISTREMKRSYLALVVGTVDEDSGTIDAPIGRDRKNRQRMAVIADGRAARTNWSVASRMSGLALLRVDLETGRSHQIRVHCAHIGHPVIGDPLYSIGGKGSAERLPERAFLMRQLVRSAKRQMLHAAALNLIHPRTGEPMAFEAPAPHDFQRLIDELERCSPIFS